MFYIYLLYSVSADKYYVGYSTNVQRRLQEHNSKPFNTYTSKYRPWQLAASFICAKDEASAMYIEKFIKKQKSRKLLKQLADPSYTPIGVLVQLVRVPDVRD